MDNKGRVSIPVRFREVLRQSQDRQLVLTNWENYIMAFPESEWAKVEANMGKVSLNKKVRNAQRFLISNAEECPLDRQGRILIPQNLRDFAELGREVAIIGMVRNFEIWDRELYESHRKELKESLDESVLHGLLIN